MGQWLTGADPRVDQRDPSKFVDPFDLWPTDPLSALEGLHERDMENGRNMTWRRTYSAENKKNQIFYWEWR